MELGAFSLSLAVDDLSASQAFYEKLGFQVVGGEPSENWLVMRNGDAKLGLFQGSLPANLLTFNPGSTLDGEPVTGPFTDVRVIQDGLQAVGVDPVIPAPSDGTGPARFVVRDPDGNHILVDQRVPRPE